MTRAYTIYFCFVYIHMKIVNMDGVVNNLEHFRKKLLQQFVYRMRKNEKHFSQDTWAEAIADCLAKISRRGQMMKVYHMLRERYPLFEEMYYDWRSPMTIRESVFEHFVSEFPAAVEALQNGGVVFHLRVHPQGYDLEGIEFFRSSNSVYLEGYQCTSLESK